MHTAFFYRAYHALCATFVCLLMASVDASRAHASNEYQGRVAVFLGYVQPLHRLVRLRMELSADAVWISRRAAPLRPGPYWALGTQVGIEFGAP